jgi:hypothetical protein
LYNKPAGCSTSGGTSHRGPVEEEELRHHQRALEKLYKVKGNIKKQKNWK